MTRRASLEKRAKRKTRRASLEDRAWHLAEFYLPPDRDGRQWQNRYRFRMWYRDGYVRGYKDAKKERKKS